MEQYIYLDEEWGEILRLPGYYASSFGKIYDSKRDRILNEYLSTNGYLQVNIEQDGIWKLLFVHRLIGFVFVPGYFDGAEINHIDGDKHNNIPENLEWVTHAENIRHRNNPDTEYHGRPRSWEDIENNLIDVIENVRKRWKL